MPSSPDDGQQLRRTLREMYRPPERLIGLSVGQARLTLDLACYLPLCRQRIHDSIPRSGELWLKCERKRCPAAWWTVVVPPGATGAVLRDLIGPPLAASFIRRWIPALREMEDDEDLWRVQLVAQGPVLAYIVAPVLPHVRHRLMYAPASDIVRELKLA